MTCSCIRQTALVLVVLMQFAPSCFASPSYVVLAEAATAPVSVQATSIDLTEARIRMLHERLQVTPAQEALWNKVAQVMRDNARKMELLLTRVKAGEEGARTAVDDVKSYCEIAEAHADSIRKFIPAFEAFYTSLSEEQKKIIEHGNIEF